MPLVLLGKRWTRWPSHWAPVPSQPSVGVALAKAVAHALHLPAVGIPTHDVLALGVLRAMGESLSRTRQSVPSRARAGRTCTPPAMRSRGHQSRPLVPARSAASRQVLDGSRRNRHVVLVGDAVLLHRDKLLAHNLGGHVTLGSDGLHAPRAELGRHSHSHNSQPPTPQPLSVSARSTCLLHRLSAPRASTWASASPYRKEG